MDSKTACIFLCLTYLSCMRGIDVAATQSETEVERNQSIPVEKKTAPSQSTQRPMITHVPELPARCTKKIILLVYLTLNETHMVYIHLATTRLLSN